MLGITLIALAIITHVGFQIWVTFSIVNSENLRIMTKVGLIAQTWLLGIIGAIVTMQQIKDYKVFPNIKF